MPHIEPDTESGGSGLVQGGAALSTPWFIGDSSARVHNWSVAIRKAYNSLRFHRLCWEVQNANSCGLAKSMRCCVLLANDQDQFAHARALMSFMSGVVSVGRATESWNHGISTIF